MIAYCRIGERSSHTWFVLKYLLGFPNVKNYDGSWTEWGNLVGARGTVDRTQSPLSPKTVFCGFATRESMKPEDYSRHQQELAGWQVMIETYKLGDVYHCTIANVDPGARFARADGETKEEAESRAIEKATRYLGQTRKFEV